MNIYPYIQVCYTCTLMELIPLEHISVHISNPLPSFMYRLIICLRFYKIQKEVFFKVSLALVQAVRTGRGLSRREYWLSHHSANLWYRHLVVHAVRQLIYIILHGKTTRLWHNKSGRSLYISTDKGRTMIDPTSLQTHFKNISSVYSA